MGICNGKLYNVDIQWPQDTTIHNQSIDQGDVSSLHKHNSFSRPWTSLPMGIFIGKLYNVQLTNLIFGKLNNVKLSFIYNVPM